MDWQAAASLERERKLEKIREKTRKENKEKKKSITKAQIYKILN